MNRTSNDLTRRQFLGVSAGVAGAALSSGSAWSMAAEPSRTFEHGEPLGEFQYGQVEFAPGPHQSQLDQTHGILMSLNEDSLLRPFRLAAGLPAPGDDLGGWYSDHVYGPDTLGQWISALSRYYAITKDEPTKAKLESLLEGFGKTIEPRGKMFDIADADGGGGSYTYDKLVCGLNDAHEFVGVSSAFELLSKMTDAASAHMPGRALDVFGPEQGAAESYTIPENQFIAWQRGAGTRHLEMARNYLHNAYFEPLARGENVLPGRHAYSHVNALCSAARAYLVLGDEKYLKAAVNGLNFVHQQSWATGGWGPGESFLPTKATDYADPSTGEKTHLPAIECLWDSLVQQHDHFETPCGSYAHFKLTRYLLRITKNSTYGDSMERVMYNTVLGALPLNKYGKAFYQSNYHGHARKAYFDGYGHSIHDEWPCCSGTFPQIAADYRISTYFRDQDGIFVNLFIPSTLRWEQNGAQISLAQSGQYPLADEVSFEVTASRPASFAVRLRIPTWAQQPMIEINGRKPSDPVKAGTFAAVRREWKSGDRIKLVLPKIFELKPVDSAHPDVVALVSGPLVLFALSEDTPKVSRAQLLSAKQQGSGSAEWRAEAAGGPLRFAPFWTIKDETYFTYLTV